jgi:hypothetical protein
MTVSFDGKFVRLAGHCPVEDAEPLLKHLSADEQPVVDLRQAGHLHTAVVQVLLAHNAEVLGPVEDGFLRAWLLPLFRGASLNTN